MRLSDMCSLPLAALWQQKTRTILTTMGVVFGTFVLAASLSTNQGVQDAIGRELGQGDTLRRVQVRQRQSRGPRIAAAEKTEVKGSMSDARRERLRTAIQNSKRVYLPEPPQKVVDQEALHAISNLDHVEAVVPAAWQFGFATVDKHTEEVNSFGVPPNSEYHRKRMVAGRFFDDAGERSAIISEFLAYRLGFVDESQMNELVGKKMRLEIRRIHDMGGSGALGPEQMAALATLTSRLPALLAKVGVSAKSLQAVQKVFANPKPKPQSDVLVEEFTIVGVIRLAVAEDNKDGWDPLHRIADVLLPLQTATEMYFTVPRQAIGGIDAVLVVDQESNIDGVVQQINGMGFDGWAFREGLKRERLMYSLIFRSMTCIAAVALFVAALGIANTMLMSVLERTREIGVMKAVGAGNGPLQLIFVIEGALIGLVGGSLGLLLAWGASYPGDLWVRSMVSRDIKVDLKEPLFVFPPWLTVSVVVFAVLVTTLAAVYPARRAAKIDPVAALRHE